MNKMYINPSVAALYFKSWWAEGKDAKPISQIRPTHDF